MRGGLKDASESWTGQGGTRHDRNDHPAAA